MESYSATSDGYLLAANGIDPVLRWDGNKQNMQEAGTPAPSTALTVTFSGTNGSITGTYYAYTRFVDDVGNVSNLSPIAGPYTATANTTVSYTNVPRPDSSKVKRRQILRNTTGQTSVFYVDIDTTDLTTTSFSSTKTDSILQVQEVVALFDSKGNALANSNGVPPSDKSYLASNLDRMFLAGEETYREGCVKTTLGSKVVYGIGTEWPDTFVGRFLWVSGADRSYEIDSVDVTNQTITLLVAYQSASLAYAPYGIRPPVTQRRLVQFSQAGLPESWPASNAVTIQEDGDDITGLMAMGSFLYILEKRHTYRLTFQEDPLTDGLVFLACNRGCVNNRCFVVVDDNSYMLDEAGIYMFSGSRKTESVSGPIQDLFEPPRKGKPYRIRWESSRYFHAVYDFGMRVIRWFVSLGSSRYPRHALCLNLESTSWWIEEFPVPIAASCEGVINGQRKVFYGGPGGAIYTIGSNTLDLVDPVRGTVRGVSTGVAPLSITDSSASFGDDIVGAPIVIVDGDGRGQVRKIVERPSATTIRIDRPWIIRPPVGSTYQIGGIQWRYRTGWFRWAESEKDNPRAISVWFEPCLNPQTMDLLLYQDRSKTPVVWDADYLPEDLSQIGTVRGSPHMKANLTGSLGFMRRRMDGHQEFYIDGTKIYSWEMIGVTNQDEAIIYQVTLDGTKENQ